MDYKAPKIQSAWQQPLSKTAYTEDKAPEEQLELKDGDKIVLALDSIAKGYVKGLYGDKIIASCDALQQKNGELYLIEFKNQPQRNVIDHEVQAKVFGSLLVVQAALYPEESLASLMRRANVFVVFQDYQSEKDESFLKIRKKVGSWAKVPEGAPLFGLKRCLERGICKTAHTIPISEFNHTYSDMIFEEE